MKTVFIIIIAVIATGCLSEELGVRGLSPTLGVTRGGEEVQIEGSGFDPGGQFTVYFGDARAKYVTISGSSRLIATTPAVSEPGKVDVRVIGGDGTEFRIRDGFEFVSRNEMAECVNIGRALNSTKN